MQNERIFKLLVSQSFAFFWKKSLLFTELKFRWKAYFQKLRDVLLFLSENE